MSPEVEVPRALRRSGAAHLAAMPGVLARISRVDMDAALPGRDEHVCCEEMDRVEEPKRVGDEGTRGSRP
jgi:hypothetical protein